MIIDRLNHDLQNNGYQRVDSNAQGIYLYYHVEEHTLSIISFIYAMNGNEMTTEQYEHILEQMKVNFSNSYSQRISLLSLVLTSNPDQAKHFIIDAKQDNHWMIDVQTNRLIMYENQSEDLRETHSRIEKLLTEEQDDQNNYQESNNYGNNSPYHNQAGVPLGRQSSRYLLTPVTMSIIAINLVAYLITHYSGILGGVEQMLEKGALSWYYIKESQEYYRLLTSMFMHADWSHLVNNMIILLFIGGNLERAAGRFKYLFIYFGTGILAGLTSISYNMWKEYANASFSTTTISIGASGAIFGLVGAILWIVIVNKGRLAQISTRQMILFIILSLYGGVVNSQIDQAAHIGGFVAGIILSAVLYRKPEHIKH